MYYAVYTQIKYEIYQTVMLYTTLKLSWATRISSNKILDEMSLQIFYKSPMLKQSLIESFFGN